MAPDSQVTTFLPSPSPALPQLPKSIVTRLGTSLALIKSQETPQWQPILQELQANGGFKKVKTEDVNKTIFLVPMTQRASLTDTLLSMIETSGISANVVTYDLLMMANAAKGNLEVVQNLFKRLKEGTDTIGRFMHDFGFLTLVSSETGAQSPHLWTSFEGILLYPGCGFCFCCFPRDACIRHQA